MSLHGQENFAGFVYLNLDHPLVLWHSVRGVYCSVDCLEINEPGSALSLSVASMLNGLNTERLKSEMAIEHVRVSLFENHVSRLRGVFVFDDIDSISRLWYGNDWGSHFNDNYMTDVGVSAKKSSRLDANWIMDVMDSSGRLRNDWLEAAKNYWSGIPHPIKEPIWERIVDGRVMIWGGELKKRAVNEIAKYWPESLSLLAYCCNAATIGSDDGIICAFLTKEEKYLNVEFRIRLIDAKDKAIFDRMDEFFEKYPEKLATTNAEPIPYTLDMSHFDLKIPYTGSVDFLIWEDGRVETNLQPPIR